MMPALCDTIAPAHLRGIQARLDAVEAEAGGRLLMAIESGSRAWGFSSPDTDYDVRLLYVHERDSYLRLRARRDVIERPIVGEIDLVGWDFRKAIDLLFKSNAAISEWIESPIRYRADHAIIGQLRALADDVLDARAIAHHFASLGLKAAERWFDDNGDVPVKKYFYALPPALAIRCLRRDPALRPPMNLQALIAACDLPSKRMKDIAVLVDAKRQTNERSNAARMPDLDVFIGSELARA